MPDDDGAVWTLYGRDFATNLGVLNVIYREIHPILNEPGAGKVTILESDALASVVDAGLWVAFDYRGSNRLGFIVEHLEYVDVDEKEGAGQILAISGRGPLALLNRAVVWDYMTPGFENIRRFGTKDVTTGYGGAPVAKGLMLYHLLQEARETNNPLDPATNRYCWRVGGISTGDFYLDWDFTDTLDSNGDPWLDAEDIEIAVNTPLLDVVRQFAALGLDFGMDWDGAGLFTLHCYRERIVDDVSDVVDFAVGTNVLKATRTTDGTDMSNAILLAVSNLALPYYNVTDPVSIGIYDRYESGMQAANAYTLASTLSLGTAELAVTANPSKALDLQVADAKAPMAYVDYNLGSTVMYSPGGTPLFPRIDGMHLTWIGEEKYARIKLETDLP
jgi:hypothetical protein